MLSETMNMLNEAAEQYPAAVSFLAGRPPNDFVDPRPMFDWIEQYVASRGLTDREWQRLGQYSETNGTICDVVANFFTNNGLPRVTARSCMITNGAQEGMLVALLGLCGSGKTAVAADPTYVGFAGAAQIAGVSIRTISDDVNFGERLAELLHVEGHNIGCVYLVPDFANPSGRTISLDDRIRIVRAAQASGATILEDAAYRRYRYDGVDIPTMFEIADGNGVIYLESFSKSLIPGIRLAALVTSDSGRGIKTVAEQLSSVKSYISVATSPISQAVLAGFLLSQDLNLTSWMKPRIEKLRNRRDLLWNALTTHFFDLGLTTTCPPDGGFFQTLNLGTEFGMNSFNDCATEAKVLVMPMSLFSLNGEQQHWIRLAFSNVCEQDIEPSVARLRKWFNNNTQKSLVL